MAFGFHIIFSIIYFLIVVVTLTATVLVTRRSGLYVILPVCGGIIAIICFVLHSSLIGNFVVIATMLLGYILMGVLFLRLKPKKPLMILFFIPLTYLMIVEVMTMAHLVSHLVN